MRLVRRIKFAFVTILEEIGMNMPVKIKNLLNVAKTKVSAAWASSKGRAAILTGGSVLAAAIAVFVVVQNIAVAQDSHASVVGAANSSSPSSASSASSDTAIESAVSSLPESAPASSAPASSATISSAASGEASASPSSQATNTGTGKTTDGSTGKTTNTDKTGATGGGTTGGNTGGTTGGGTTGGNTGGGNTGGNTGGGTTGGGTTGGTTGGATGGGTAPDYKGVDVTRSFTDEINPSVTQTIQFLGMGANHSIVAAANIGANTTPDMGAAHHGAATFTVDGPVTIPPVNTRCAKDGQNTTHAVGSLTAGTYTVRLTTEDGKVVAQYHFTVQSNGTVA